MKTLYDLLGVQRRATLIEIERGYRRHLDRHLVGKARGRLRKKDQLRLQRVRDAFLVLSSPQRRDAYDQALLLREYRRDRAAIMGRILLGACALVTGLLLIAASVWSRPVFKPAPYPGNAAPDRRGCASRFPLPCSRQCRS